MREQESEKNRERGRVSCLRDDRAASTHQLHSRSNRHRRPLLLLVYSLTTWQQEIKTVAHYTKPKGLSLILGNFPSEFAANLNYYSYSSHIQYLCCLCIFIQQLSARESSKIQDALRIQPFVAYKSLIIVSAVIAATAGY